MPEVLAIEHAGHGRPWREEEFLRVLRGRDCIGMVAERGEAVVGFMIYELHRDRIECLRLAVHPDWRRRGVGRALVQKLAGKLSAYRRNRLCWTASDGNLAGHLFLRACGARAVRVLRGASEGGGDAYRFRLEAPAAVPAMQGADPGEVAS
jgi:ribosomal-protein-alanine N-acetyltransferase